MLPEKMETLSTIKRHADLNESFPEQSDLMVSEDDQSSDLKLSSQ